MYRVSEFLTPKERLEAIQLGAMHELASNGIGPGEYVRMMKRAQDASGKADDASNWMGAVLKLSLGLGIPIGALSYALSSAIRPDRNKNKKLKAELDEIRNISSQYARSKDMSAMEEAPRW